MNSVDHFVSRARHSILRAVVALTDRFPAEAPIQHAFLLRQLAAALPPRLTRGQTKGLATPDFERLDACDSATAALKTFLERAEEEGHTSEQAIQPVLERIDDIRRLAEHLRARSCAAVAA
jgi:hypothetical protein